MAEQVAPDCSAAADCSAQVKSVQGGIFEEAERTLGNRPPADAELREDQRRLAWSRHPNGVLGVSVLRMMALAILSVARLLTRIEYSLEAPIWAQVADHFLLQLCDSILESEAFDNV